MNGKHVRQFPRWNLAARFGIVLILSGSIGAGVLVAARDPRPARALFLAAQPAAARRPARAAAVTSPRATRAPAPGPRRPAPPAATRAGICTSPSPAYRALASWMSRGIRAAVHGSAAVGLAVADTRTGISCEYHAGQPFDSASIVKVLILGALLHEVTAHQGMLSDDQAGLARKMITESDNDAAGALWDEAGRGNLQLFLDQAGMSHTTLGPGILWGLTQVTARDELRLLTLLTSANPVLNRRSRDYELRLMAQVIPAQRWGVPADARPAVTVQLKNGWLPDLNLWVVNSIGAFTSDDGVYKIVVLTRDNPTLDDGIAIVQGVAAVANRALAPR